MGISILKRIRRHITGRTRDYFAVTAPGFETLCADELMRLPLSVKEAAAVVGGVEFKGRLPDCWLANLHLRTPTRILMRIDTFKAADFDRLEHKISEIPWEIFLYPRTLSRIYVSTKHSRLYHKDAIKERVERVITNHLKEAMNDECEMMNDECGMMKQDVHHSLFIRAVDDRFIISIDTSGELLYKRGIKQHGAEAPLRETTAAAILMLAGYIPGEPLIDPMCGSGTFSLEAAMISAKMPPGLFRNFAFMGFPSFAPKRWDFIHKSVENQISRIDHPVIFASDNDSSACHALESTIKEHGFNEIQVSFRDFFDFRQKKVSSQPGLIVINPPYGRRVGTQKESVIIFNQICEKLKKDYRGWKAALIAPTKNLAAKVPFSNRRHSFYHGGILRELVIGRI